MERQKPPGNLTVYYTTSSACRTIDNSGAAEENAPNRGESGCRKSGSGHFSREMRARWTSIPDGKVGPPCARSVISKAHVLGNDGFSFDSCGFGRRNSARLSFREGFSTRGGRPPPRAPPPSLRRILFNGGVRHVQDAPVHGRGVLNGKTQRRMISWRLGPVDTVLTGTPMCFSMKST